MSVSQFEVPRRAECHERVVVLRIPEHDVDTLLLLRTVFSRAKSKQKDISKTRAEDMAARNRLHAVFLGNPVQPGLERRNVRRYERASLPGKRGDLCEAGRRPSERAETADSTDAVQCSHSPS